jgi:hypothetical protein
MATALRAADDGDSVASTATSCASAFTARVRWSTDSFYRHRRFVTPSATNSTTDGDSDTALAPWGWPWFRVNGFIGDIARAAATTATPWTGSIRD